MPGVAGLAGGIVVGGYARRVCLAILVVLSLSGCADPRRFTPLPPGAVVLAFGDSITAGVGAPPGKGYPTRLANETGWQVVNAGVSGDTARAAVKRLAPLLASHQPELVIVELGGNDFLRRASAAQVRSHLQAIAREALASGAVVALVAVPEFSLLRASVGALSDSPIYEELADEDGVILIPDLLSEVLSDDALRADEIHPNARGYKQLTSGIMAALSATGLLASG